MIRTKNLSILVPIEKTKAIFLHTLRIKNGKAVDYAGFGWKKSGRFTRKAQWNAYLNQFTEQLANPMQIEFR